MTNLKSILTGTLVAAAVAFAPSVGADDAIDMALKNEYRKEGDAARDSARNPAAFLRFLGVTETSHVGEVNPGGGWYSRVLAPLVREKGRYVGLEHHPDLYKEFKDYSANLAKYPEKVDAARDMYGPNAVGTWIPSAEGLPVDEKSLDAVIVVRAMHNWHRRNFFDKGLQQIHAMLKDDGVLGVVQHRMGEDAAGDRYATTRRGRWKQSELVAAIESYGFKLVEASEMNANAKDEANYPGGVWTLPPVLGLGDKDRAKYEAVGESDRMTLKFKKSGM